MTDITALPPRPVPDPDTQPYWDAVAERRLVVPRCATCGVWIWLPRPLCPRCHAPDPVWTQVDGGGALLSWTTIHPPVLPAWADDVPFTIVLVALDEGVRMVGRLADAEPDQPQIGARMSLSWRTDATQSLPAWTPA